MARHLDIYDRRERLLVGAADAAIAAALLPARLRRRRPPPVEPRRILLLRLERIGDLLMSLGAIAAVRRLAAEAEITLAVGSWNEPLARLIPGIDRLEVLDAPWLARQQGAPGALQLARRALSWRSAGYELSINFEGDIRSHVLPWLAGAERRVGFAMAGGGRLLTDIVPHEPRRHTAANGLALVEQAFGLAPGTLPGPESPAARRDWRLALPGEARAAARACLGALPPGPVIALHPGGGRAVKQWHPERFADAGATLARELDAAVLITGSEADAPVTDIVARRLASAGVRFLRTQGTVDLVVLAALLERSRLMVTGDTGPMHLAAAVGTPVVAVFGPSLPARYAPLPTLHRIVRVDLPCSPCNRIRKPPARCEGRVPDCLDAVTTHAVIEAAHEVVALSAAAEGAQV